jgi:hypothetical protein
VTGVQSGNQIASRLAISSGVKQILTYCPDIPPLGIIKDNQKCYLLKTPTETFTAPVLLIANACTHFTHQLIGERTNFSIGTQRNTTQNQNRRND